LIRNSATAVIIATFATAVACLPMSGDADVQHDALRHAEHRRAVSLGVTYFPTFSKPLIPPEAEQGR
jgi:hypothetical protein